MTFGKDASGARVFITQFRPVHWRIALLLASGAVICFNLAYSLNAFGPLRLLIFGYLTCLVQLARLATTRQCFYTALTVGFLCAATRMDCFWRIFGPAAIPLWLVLGLWTALFVTVVHLMLTRWGNIRAASLLGFVWTGLEYFRSELYYLKFSWLNIGYAFADWPAFSFHFLGMYGIGFFAALLAGLFLIARPIVASGVAMGMMAVSLLVAVSPMASNQSAQAIHIAGVQMEFPMERRLAPALDRLLIKHPNADVMVLSEYTLDESVPDSLKLWCRTNHRYLVVGGRDVAPGGQFYNTAFVIGPDGEIIFRQVKSVPIQFFRDGLPAPRQAVWDSPWGKIGICICYDLSYTRVTDRLVKMGAQLLIVPTMDVAEWGERQHELHGLVAPTRAAEYRLPIFRLASSGISQAVNPDGRVAAHTTFPGDEESLAADFRLPPEGSLPMDRFAAPVSVGVTGMILLLLGYSAFMDRQRTSQRPTETIPVHPS